MSKEHFELRTGVSLSGRTTLELGGPAEFLADAASADGIAGALDWADRRGLALNVLGGGSNLVVADAGVRGMILSPRLHALDIAQVDAETIDLHAGGGLVWDELVALSVERNWAGLECLSGIPGSVGATPIQNVGAYGQEVAQTLISVDVHDRQRGCALSLSAAECGFEYRGSRFKHRDAGRFIVLAATFRLRAGGAPCLGYPEIARQFSDRVASLGNVRHAVLETRRGKSMLLDRSDENARSCGSFFLNPELSQAELEQLRARCPSAPPSFPMADGRSKIPAAWLIEQAGFRRGQRWGAVGISSRHSLALVCHAGATSRALLEIAHRVRDGVAHAFGLWLRPEPQFLGFGPISDGLPPLS